MEIVEVVMHHPPGFTLPPRRFCAGYSPICAGFVPVSRRFRASRMQVPSQGPHGGGAERCYTGNEPHETCLLHTRPMRSPGVAWGVDPVTITNDH